MSRLLVHYPVFPSFTLCSLLLSDCSCFSFQIETVNCRNCLREYYYRLRSDLPVSEPPSYNMGVPVPASVSGGSDEV